jgi:hypothetical protein
VSFYDLHTLITRLFSFPRPHFFPSSFIFKLFMPPAPYSFLHPFSSARKCAPPTILNVMERPFGLRSFRRNIFALRMMHLPDAAPLSGVL